MNKKRRSAYNCSRQQEELKISKKGKKAPRGQLSLWEEWEASSPEIIEVADQFIFANCYNPQVAGSILQKNRSGG
jgi:putative transposase